MSGSLFPSTRLSAIRDAQSDDSALRDRAVEVLVGIYWKPVYTYVRWRWRAAPEDAEDLVQGFFARALEKEFFARYEPERARFRTFLRLALDGYVANENRAATRQKRGGGLPHLSLDFESAEGELRERALPQVLDPETLFEREWVRSLFSVAVERLRSHCDAVGKPAHFALFERYDLEGPEAAERPTYRELAQGLGLPETQVTNFLAWTRREFRRSVLELLRELCGSEAEFRAEARALLGSDP